MTWKTGDWVVFDLSVGQIKEMREGGGVSVSDGMFETSGLRLAERFRPLTLRNKRIVETFEVYYGRLKEIAGHGGFNFPDISQHFAQLALDAIDGGEAGEKQAYEKAQTFVGRARDYEATIQGVPLFRPNPQRALA